MLKLAPSILAADFACLGDNISQAVEGGAQYIHVDVMDGRFVNNLSVGEAVVSSISKMAIIKEKQTVLDVHLMVQRPYDFIESFANAGADIINFHLEAEGNPFEIIKKIKGLGKRAAITIKPETPAREVFKYLSEVGMVLVMSVEPGFGGQKIMDSCLEKAKVISEYIKANNLDVDIEMDGGITIGNVKKVINCGVNVVVSGSEVFRNVDYDIKGAVAAFFKEFGGN
ncbi:MAG: ribulose-phosphate 3-epimerase [Clostridiales bacterium]|nr:ribulose-phosphate 3-epimerase [Clostridiales bacterium]